MSSFVLRVGALHTATERTQWIDGNKEKYELWWKFCLAQLMNWTWASPVLSRQSLASWVEWWGWTVIAFSKYFVTHGATRDLEQIRALNNPVAFYIHQLIHRNGTQLVKVIDANMSQLSKCLLISVLFRIKKYKYLKLCPAFKGITNTIFSMY